MENYKGKVVVVAGGTGGVGEGIAKWFADHEATVIIPTRNIQKVSHAKEYIAPNSDNLIFIEGNLSDEMDAIRIRNEIIDTYGKIDAMVSSLFGWWQGEALVDVSLDRWKYLIDSTLTSHFIVAKTFVPFIQSGGSYNMIIGLSSMTPVPHSGPISVGNAAEVMLRRVLSAENNQQEIRINDINLGPINTRTRHPLYQSPEYIDATEVGRIAGIIAFGEGKDITDETIALRLKPDYQKWLNDLGVKD